MRLRARHLRLVIQGIFLIVFMALIWGLAFSPVPGRVASSLLALYPLTPVATALADCTVPGWAWLGAAVLAHRRARPLLLRLGVPARHPPAAGVVDRRPSNRRARAKLNRYRRWFAVKYVVLTVLLVWAALGTSHVGWLAPLPLLHRAVAAHAGQVFRTAGDGLCAAFATAPAAVRRTQSSSHGYGSSPRR